MVTPTSAELALPDEIRQLRERIAQLEDERLAVQAENRRAVAALEAEKDRLSAVITAISDEVWFSDAQKRFVLVNPAAARQFHLDGAGTEVAELAASLEVFRPDGSPRPVEEAPPLRALHGEVLHGQEEIIRTPDSGQLRHREVSAAPVRDASGNIIGSVSVVRDITARKLAEEALHNQRESLRVTLNSIGDAVLATDPAGRITLLNPEAARLTGWTEEEAIGRMAGDVFRIVNEITREPGEDIVARVLQEDATIALANHSALLTKAGTEVPIEDTAAPIRGRAGEVNGVVLVFHDVTAKRRAQAELVSAHEEAVVQRNRLSAVLEALPVGVALIGPDGGAIRSNAAFERIWGGAPVTRSVADYAAYQAWWSATGQPVQPEEWASARAVQKGETVVDQELRIRRFDGSTAFVLNSAAPIYDAQGRIAGSAVAISDVSALKRAEEELRQSEALMRTFFDSPGVMRGIADLVDGQIVHVSCNAVAAELYGVDRESISGKTITEAGGTEEIARVWAALYEEALRTGRAVSLEYLRRSADSRQRWLLGTVFHLGPGPSGHPRFGYTCLDITERKNAEEQLARSQKTFSELVERAPFGIYVIDSEFRIAHMNAGSQNGAFRNVRPLIGRDFSEAMRILWPEPVAADIIALFRHTLETGEPYYSPRFVNPRHDIETVESYEWELHRMTLPDGQYGVICYYFDSTRLREAEEALRQSSRKFEDVIDGSPGPVSIKDLEGRFITINQTLEQLLGVTRDELKGKTDYDIFSRDRAEYYRGHDRSVAESGKPMQVEEVVELADGRRRVFLSNKFPLRDAHGKIYAVCGISTDITEMKLSEERLRQSQRLESVGLLAGGVAHDFNNLLIGVIGNASLAQEMLPSGHPASELMHGVIKTGEQLAHLTRQMLAYSGKGKFVVEPLDLSAVVRDISELVRPSIPKKVAVRLDLQEDLPSIEADRGQVQQILMNLVINAAEAIGSRDGLITVSTGTRVVDDAFIRREPAVADLHPGEYVVLEVLDTGCGMVESVRAKIFEPFFSTKFTGRGLGLAAVAGIVRGHKGAIMVSSEPGKGSVFTVLFPAAAHGTQWLPGADPRAASRGSGVVLIIDDEKVVREVARKALELNGYTVLAAYDGSAALDILKRHPGRIDIAILDLSMPGMSGEETLLELRKIRPDIKVLVSSGYSEAEAMTMFMGQQVSGFIQKPYAAAALAGQVKIALG